MSLIWLHCRYLYLYIICISFMIDKDYYITYKHDVWLLKSGSWLVGSCFLCLDWFSSPELSVTLKCFLVSLRNLNRSTTLLTSYNTSIYMPFCLILILVNLLYVICCYLLLFAIILLYFTYAVFFSSFSNIYLNC